MTDNIDQILPWPYHPFHLPKQSKDEPEITQGKELQDFVVNVPQRKSEYYTVKFKRNMNRRQVRLTLQTVLDLVIRSHYITLADFLIIDELTSRVRSYLTDDAENKKDPKEKESFWYYEVLLISEILLKYAPAEGKEFSREGSENFSSIIQEAAKQCSEFSFSSDRTLGSRLKSYAPGHSLEITVVIPLSLRERNTQPYSSYTKGYQESHPDRRGKTPHRFELDGEDIWSFDTYNYPNWIDQIRHQVEEKFYYDNLEQQEKKSDI